MPTFEGTMSDDLHFSSNYRDLCQQYGTGAGFQFEFYCQSCSDTWRSPFAPYRSGQASGWMREIGSFASNLLGGVSNGIDNAVEGLAKAGWGTSRDEAFKDAIGAAEHHFHRCARCNHYVCDRCWSIEKGLCETCAPDLAAEVQAARHQGQLQAAKDNAVEFGKSQAGKVDVKTERQLVCPQCGCEARGGKFCPDCGHRLADPSQCGGCQAELPAGSRFCPECGQATGTAVRGG
ncbi:zinc ribbon domain-containing protein [Dyella sp. LX-66]|uniref:zinc ribbon domain-containing protein n=2 Tax=unclassified Dyella TaxID=2634549 RepID=UPI001BE028B6|nr:zinc ribbon domain-containing protein [Dyella sp. LX-66]